MKDGQIVLCNLKLRTLSGRLVYLKDIIFSKPYESERNVLIYSKIEDRNIICKTKLKEDLFILDIEIIKELGFKHKSNNFTKAIKSDEKRNTITGAYE